MNEVSEVHPKKQLVKISVIHSWRVIDKSEEHPSKQRTKSEVISGGTMNKGSEEHPATQSGIFQPYRYG
jgi:hypothetical protein